MSDGRNMAASESRPTGERRSELRRDRERQRATPPTAGVSAGRGIYLVARREILTQVRSKAFLWSLAITLLFIIGGMIAGSFFVNKMADDARGNPKPVAVTQAAAPYVDAEVMKQAHFTVQAVPNVAAATSLVQDGSVKALIALPAELTQTPVYHPDAGKSDPVDPAVLVQPTGNSARVVVVGKDSEPDGLTKALTVKPHSYVLTAPENPAWLRPFLSSIFGVFFFFSAIQFCSRIAQSTVEEKSTRVVEILLATVTPRTILAGKILGNTVLALAQIALIAAVSLVGMKVMHLDGMFDAIGPAVGTYLVFFLLGFVMLASLYAGAAALVSRQEDVAQVTTPLMLLILVPYILAFQAGNNDTLLRIMSFVPFSSPVSMPVRVATGDTQWWEPLVSLAILVATCLAAIWLGAKLYENSVLRTGGRVKFRDALKAS